MKQRYLNFVRSILEILLLIMFIASIVNVIVIFIFQIPIMFPLISFSAVRFMFISFFEGNIFFFLIATVVLGTILSSVVFIYFQKTILPMILGIYLVADTFFLAFLFFKELLIGFYFDSMYFFILLWHGGILALLLCYFYLLKFNRSSI